MEYNSHARPINRWLMTNERNPLVPIKGVYYTLEMDHLGQPVKKEGGMGVVYRCHYLSLQGEKVWAWIKHAKIDETKEELLNKLLDDRNKEIQREINIQSKVAELDYAPQVIAQSNFSANNNEPKFTTFVQNEAKVASLYDLKDTLTHSERVVVLTHFFEALIALHERGIYHCDLDLHHVYWEEHSKKIHLIDWGGGIIENSCREVTAIVKGKLCFSPPEQRDIDNPTILLPKSEVFSAGAVAYYFLSDLENGNELPKYYRYPDDYDGYDLLGLEQLPDSITETIVKATRSNSEDRLETIEELLKYWNDKMIISLPCLTIQDKTSTISTVSEENTNFSDFGLEIDFQDSNGNPSWIVKGDFEVFTTLGSNKGQWANVKELEIFKRSKIIRINQETNRCLMFKVNNVKSLRQKSEHISDETENEVFYEEKSTGRFLQLLPPTQMNGKVRLEYIDGDLGGIEIDENDISSHFTLIL
jgi:serine/threonine protein kinase